MILACQNIQKSFGTDVILKNASFHIEDREKAAIVGINGAGKSTLLKNHCPSDGRRRRRSDPLCKGKTLGYLAQHDAVSSENTIYEELLRQTGHSGYGEEDPLLEQEMKTLEGEALTAVLGDLQPFKHRI